MKIVLIVIVALALTGCLRLAAPTMINGNYYMAGDSKCVRGNFVSSTTIQCMDRKGNFTEYRNALNHGQVVDYQVQIQQLQQQIQQTGQTFQDAGERIRQQSQSWTPPQAQPISPQGSGNTTYRQVGNTWMGSNGSSCQVIGQSILCSDGKRCQVVGQSLICN